MVMLVLRIHNDQKNGWANRGEAVVKFYMMEYHLGGGFKYFLFSPLPGEMIQIDEHIFQIG